QTPHVQLVFEPEWHGQPETGETLGGVGEIGFQQAFELRQGLVIKSHKIEVLRTQPRFPKAVGDGFPGEIRIVLLSGESLLLSSGDDLAVDHKRSGTVVVKGRNSQDRGHARPCPCLSLAKAPRSKASP